LNTRSSKSHPVFLLQQPVDHGPVLGDSPVAPLGSRHREAAAVDGVHHDVDRLEIRRVQDPHHDAERIVFEVLVADGVVRVEPQHRRHVALFEVPDAVVREDRRDLLRECNRVVEVVEHRDRRDDLRGRRGDAPEGVGREEVRNDRQGVRVELGKLLGRRVDADPAQAGDRVGFQQRAVVAANVQHDIT
jgi:hypothetical protein